MWMMIAQGNREKAQVDVMYACDVTREERYQVETKRAQFTSHLTKPQTKSNV